jgi:lipoprotein NlpD
MMLNMFFRALKPSTLTLWLLFMLLMACAQSPNYAPVKTVNQTIEPENGYVHEKSPINPGNDADRQQNSAKIIHKEQENSLVRQPPIISSARPGSYKPYSTDQAVRKEAASVPITSNKNSAYQNQLVQKPTPLPFGIQVPTKNKTVNPAVDSNSASKSKKSAASDQRPNSHPKNNPIISNTNDINTHKNQQNNVKPLDHLQLSGKNNKEKTSIISIDNKKVLKLNFQWPIQGKISRNFPQTDNKGIDITGKAGQSVRAAEAGKAVYCGQGLVGLGNLVIIKHDETYLSAYANNSRLYIKEGQHVEKGQSIGQVSAAGRLKKASLHFEIRKNGKSINPLTLLPKH